MPEQWEMRQLHEQIYDLSERVSRLGERVSSLETWRDNEKTKHAATPTWLFGIIAAIISGVTLLLNLWLAGVRP